MTLYTETTENWELVKLNEICHINPKKPLAEDNIDVTFLPMALVHEETGQYLLTETRKYDDVKKGYSRFINGDVIFAKITPCMENGKVALVNNLVNSVGFGSTEFHVIRPSQNIEGQYVFYFLVQRAFRKFAQRKMTGSAGQLRVPKSVIETTKIPLSPLPEQRAIVAKIEQLFSELDNGIANLKTAKEKLEIYRQAVLKKAFEGELTRGWREKKLSLAVDTNVNWQAVKLGEVAEIKRGKSKHRPRNDKKLFGGPYPFIQTGDVKSANGGVIRKYSQTYSEVGLEQSKLWPMGTLCLTIAANIADTAFLGFDACFPDSVVGISTNTNVLSPEIIICSLKFL